MHGLGLTKGDRVALLLPDCREYLEADYGTMAAGFVRVPMDPRLTRRELAALLLRAGVRALVTHPAFTDKVERLTDDVESLQSVVCVGNGPGLAYESLLEKSSEQPLPQGDGDDLATLNFSGGTTGAPKAVMLRHRNLMTVAANTIQGFDIPSDAVFLNVRPLWPIAQVILMSHLFAGATVVLGGRFDAGRLAALIDESGATRTSLVPTQLVRWIEHLTASDRMPKLEAIYVGGSRIPSTVFEHGIDLIGPRIGVLYGMTEAPICCYLRPQELAGDQRVQLMESVGRSFPAYRMRLADAGDAADASGEVLVQGGNVMAGYWQNEDATREALRDGWLHTGDIGTFDSDGRLSIVGRLKDVIRSGSSSIMPKEVEDVIAAHPGGRRGRGARAARHRMGRGRYGLRRAEARDERDRARPGGALPCASRELQKAPRGALRREPAALALRQGDPRRAARAGRNLAVLLLHADLRVADDRRRISPSRCRCTWQSDLMSSQSDRSRARRASASPPAAPAPSLRPPAGTR